MTIWSHLDNEEKAHIQRNTEASFEIQINTTEQGGRKGHIESAGQNMHGVGSEASTEFSRRQVSYGVRSSDPLQP